MVFTQRAKIQLLFSLLFVILSDLLIMFIATVGPWQISRIHLVAIPICTVMGFILVYIARRSRDDRILSWVYFGDIVFLFLLVISLSISATVNWSFDSGQIAEEQGRYSQAASYFAKAAASRAKYDETHAETNWAIRTIQNTTVIYSYKHWGALYFQAVALVESGKPNDAQVVFSKAYNAAIKAGAQEQDLELIEEWIKALKKKGSSSGYAASYLF